MDMDILFDVIKEEEKTEKDIEAWQNNILNGNTKKIFKTLKG
jgi:hypothetical protein